mgnify:CR=1 FL=1
MDTVPAQLLGAIIAKAVAVDVDDTPGAQRLDLAFLRGLRLRRWDFLFYAVLGTVVTSSVQIAGVLLVGDFMLDSYVYGDALRISVWDTGVGIDEADSAVIFQEFQRLEYAEHLDEKGLGLGLAICRDYSEMMGGKISVESTAGEGSTFTVILPADPESAHAAA